MVSRREKEKMLVESTAILNQAKEHSEKAQTLANQAGQSASNAQTYLDEIQSFHSLAKESTNKITKLFDRMKEYNSQAQDKESKQQKESIEAAKDLAEHNDIPLIEQLRAQAILLSDKADQSKSYQDYLQAFKGWKNVLKEDSLDEQASFNAGLQAYYLYQEGNRTQQIYWFPEIEQYYRQALAIKPDKHEAANNWGNALHGEAQALATQGDTATALEKWRDAGEKFQQALAIKPDMHEAAYNCGATLADEAQALAAQGDTVTALEKWRDAGEKYRQALAIKPDKHEAAYNWGLALHSEAQALAAQNKTDKALEKWREAGEKYQRALAIKPDMHEATHNWLNTLLREHHALKDNQPAEAQTKLQQARDLVNDFLSKNPQHKENLAYNHACLCALEGNAAEAVKQLRLAQQANNFPDKDHIQTDPDFDNIRHTPEFQTWFKEAFPESSAKANPE